jgi:dienelactone hydrolase
MRRRSALLFLAGPLALVLGAGSADAAYRADGDLSDWRGDPTLLAGESTVSRGELIHDDYLYDDYGANLDQGPNPPDFRSYLAPTRGDYRYPDNSQRYGYNAADLRQLRLAADGRGLHIAAFLQTMKAPDAAAVTLAIDSDRNSSTGTAAWPHGVGIQTPGIEHFVTSWGAGGWVSSGRGKKEPIRTQALNLDENAIEIEVPWAQIPRLRGSTIRVYVVTGLADPASRQYVPVPAGTATATAPGGGLPGSTAAFDVGFDSEETATRLIGSHWGEELQSQALANRDVAAMSETVDLDLLESRGSIAYQPEPGRFYNRIFRSSQNYGEGINLKQNPASPGGSPDPQFLSPHQPYGLYIPADYQAGTPAPLLLMGHSLDVNHNEYKAISPNLYTQLGDERSAVVITPLARGLDTWYIDSGFWDVLEAWEDTKANYSIDDDRTHISGYSMGGYMSFRMGLLMPDHFAAAAPYVGPPAYQIWFPPGPPQPSGPYQFIGQTNNIIYNGLDLPFEINNGALDELVPVLSAEEQAQTFRELGRPHTYYLYPTADHFALIGADEWGHTRDFLDAHPVRNLNQIEVAFRYYPSMDLPSLGLRFDGAYWVDRLALRNNANQQSFGQVDAVTFAQGGNRTLPQDFSSNYPGPVLPATVRGTNRVPGGPITQRNGFQATLTNLSGIAFATGRMGIDPAQQITATLTGDGNTTVTLLGQFPAVTATVDGQPVAVQQTAEGIEITADLTGQRELVVTPQ